MLSSDGSGRRSVISATLLLVYAVTAGTLGVAYLLGASWVVRAPRTAILMWQSLAISIMLAMAGAGAALAVSLAPIGSRLAAVLHLCASSLRHGYASSGGTATALIGLLVLALLLARLGWYGRRVMVTGYRERRDCRRMVLLVGRADDNRDAVILDHPQPYAFCVAGRRPAVVLTTGLTESLSEPEIRAVLAHESGHIAQRHHLCLNLSETLFLALGRPFWRFRQALPQVRVLLELSADDYARRREGDAPLHAALTKLACLSTPHGALAASSDGVTQRLDRIEERSRPLGWMGISVTAVASGLVIALPVALAAAPAAEMARAGLCLIG